MRKIPLEDIELNDQRFRISFFCSLNLLSQSIQAVGLIYPPVVTLRNGFMVPVTGWRRILACKQLLMSPIPVFVSKETDDLKSFKLAIFENLTSREFDLIERAEIVSRLKKFGEAEEKIIKKYLPLLRIPPTYDYYDLYKKISQMRKAEKYILSQKKMVLAVVELLVQFSPKERKLFFPLLVCLSRNKQKELLETAKEISLKRDIPVSEIFSSEEIKGVLHSGNFSTIQKADRIRELLKKKRFPLLSDREKSFEYSKKKLKWPRDIDLSPTPYYEDNMAHIKFSFSGYKDYLKKISVLRSMAEKDEFTALIETVSDE